MRNLFAPASDLRPRLLPTSACHGWFTWSVQTRTALHQLSEELPKLPKPTVEYFAKGEYEYSIVWEVRELLSPRLRWRLDSIAWALHRIRIETELIMLDNLMDKQIDGTTIRGLFAWVRSALVSRTCDPTAAIYAPPGAVGGTAQGDFPLHADFYAPAVLFNVFDRVPSDGSGAALFLPMQALLHAIDVLPSIPSNVRLRFRELITQPSANDHYEEFYDLLHGEHPWVASLENAIAADTMRVPLSRGQGYLLHDRHWLHGRQKPRSRVGKDRLHRLIFDTDRTLKFRLCKTGDGEKRRHSLSRSVSARVRNAG